MQQLASIVGLPASPRTSARRARSAGPPVRRRRAPPSAPTSSRPSCAAPTPATSVSSTACWGAPSRA